MFRIFLLFFILSYIHSIYIQSISNSIEIENDLIIKNKNLLTEIDQLNQKVDQLTQQIQELNSTLFEKPIRYYPTLLGYYENYNNAGTQDGSFYKDNNGIVHLEGLLMTTDNVVQNDPIFWLPPGFMPAYDHSFVTYAFYDGERKAAYIAINNLGKVFSSLASGKTFVQLSLDGIVFQAAD